MGTSSENCRAALDSLEESGASKELVNIVRDELERLERLVASAAERGKHLEKTFDKPAIREREVAAFWYPPHLSISVDASDVDWLDEFHERALRSRPILRFRPIESSRPPELGKNFFRVAVDPDLTECEAGDVLLFGVSALAVRRFERGATARYSFERQRVISRDEEAEATA